MKRKISVIGIVVAIVAVLAVWALPVFADGGIGVTTDLNAKKARPMVRLLLVQDEAKVDTLIAKAVTDGKLTAEQAVKVKAFWTANHTKFTKRLVMGALLRAKDQTKVQAFLDKAVAAGKIQEAQADKIIQIWVMLHTPAPVAAQ